MAIASALVGIDDIVTQIYQGVLETNPWSTFLRLLQQHTDSDAALLYLHLADGGVTPIGAFTSYSPCELENSALTALPGLQQAHGTSPLLHSENKQSHCLDELEWLRAPDGRSYGIDLRVSECDSGDCHLRLIGGTGAGNFGVEVKDFLLNLRPHLECALRAFNQLQRADLEKQIYSGTLEQLGIGAIVLDSRGQMLEINQIANNILRDSASIHMVDGKPVLANLKCHAQLQEVIEKALASHDRDTSDCFVEALRVADPSQPGLSLLIRTVPGGKWCRSEFSPAAVIYLSDALQESLIPEHLVAQLFDLTRSEAQLATQLANGLTLAEAAQKLGITLNSARTYSKKVFAKTGASRQAELVGLVVKSIAAFAGAVPAENRLCENIDQFVQCS